MLRHFAAWCVALAVSTAAGSAQDESPRAPLRVSLLGDSIVAGAHVEDPRQRPAARLEQHLRSRWPDIEVQEFGAGATTLLRNADWPYVLTPKWSAAVESAPAVAVVMLGTNDTCLNDRRRCWEHESELEQDAQGIVAALRENNPSVRVLLCTPPPMFPADVVANEGRRQALTGRAARIERIGQALNAAAIASGPGARFVDLARTLRAGDTVDGVHPNPFGVAKLAERLALEIDLELRGGAAPDLELARRLSEESISAESSSWFGFRRLDFELPALDEQGKPAACTLVLPHAMRPGAPWVWRARFFGHEPALDLGLLDFGYHVGYCDVAGLFGGPEAVARWERFRLLTLRLGLGPLPVLEGMSRGALPVLRYAAKHKWDIGAIYLDNPVIDPRSWPGGRTGKRSDSDWASYLQAYGLEEEAAWARDPLADINLRELVEFPVYLVVGERDTVVPPVENAFVLEAALRAEKLPLTVWRKPGLDHHPHGLTPVEPLLRQLAASGLRLGPLPAPPELGPATHALPSVEYRGQAAGWGGGTWWEALETLEQFQSSHADVPVVFLGDSITQGLTGHSDRLARQDGERAIDRYFGDIGALSLGLSGDRTEHLLFRIDREAFRASSPRVVVLQIGVNDIRSAGRTPSELVNGINMVVRELQNALPEAHVLVCGPFPTGASSEDPYRRCVDETHALIQTWDWEKVWRRRARSADYVDLRGLFLDASGAPNECLSGDLVHITSAGQAAWMQALRPHVEAALAD